MLELVHRDMAPDGAETFVFVNADRGTATVRARRSESGVFRVLAAHAVGGCGPDDDAELAEEAAAIAAALG